ncbi:unnamed protein product [Ectocarpus sp. CCAP 1310/34]|nr:unnamed protein product [Ectocarpus sp. CCAP 1310/34]
MMPGFSDDADRQARQAALVKSDVKWQSSNVSVEDSSAPSDIGSQSGDVVFEKEIREAMTGGGGAGTRTTNHGKREASACGSVVGKNKAAASHHASAKKARGKDYPHWATHFLKRTCAHRKIPRKSQKIKDVLVVALRSFDANMKWPSPYFDDLDAIAAGESGRGSEQEEGEEEGAIPAKALLMLRGVVNMVALARDRTEPFTVEGVDCSVADLYDAMEKEAKPELEDSAGGTGGSGSITERKGLHCMMRLVGILCEDSIRPLVMSSRLQEDPRHNVRAGGRGLVGEKIVDDEQVSHVNPNIIQHPKMSSEEITKMWSAAKAKWNTPNANWKSESGNNQPWPSFCQGKRWVT